MNKIFGYLVLVGIFIFPEIQQAVASQEILDEVRAAYQNMNSYSSQMEIIEDFTIAGQPDKTTTSASIKLLKPNFYNISWKQESQTSSGEASIHQGVVWNNEKGSFMYNEGSYIKAISDKENIAAALNYLAGWRASTIPMLFFHFDEDLRNTLDTHKDVQLTGSELIDGEDCYILELSPASAPISKEIYWISKSRKVFLKIKEISDADPNRPTVSGTKTILYKNIEINPKLDAANLEYLVPSGTVLQ